MDHYPALLRIATTGLARGAALPPVPAVLAGRAPGSKGLKLWQALGSSVLALRAGYQPVPLAAPLPAAPAPASRPALPRAASQLLRQALRKRDFFLLQAGLERARARGYRLSPDLLPALLDLSLREPGSLDMEGFWAVAGARGRWLAAQHEGWQRLLPPAETNWEQTAPAQQRAFLRQARQSDPAQVRQWLQATGGRLRPAWLATLAVNLSEADRPWLEELAAGKRREWREAAQQLLLLLPDSELAQQIWQAVRPCLTRKRQLKAKPLKQLPAWWQAAGLSQQLSLGVAREWQPTCLLLAHCPPTRWTTELGAPPERLIKEALASPAAEPLLLGWIMASIRFEAEPWAAALSHTLLFDDPRTGGSTLPLAQRLDETLVRGLARTLSPAGHDELVQGALQAFRKRTAPSFVFRLLADSPWTLSEQTASLLAQKVIGMAEHFPDRMGYALRHLFLQLPEQVHLFPLASYPELANRWARPADAAEWFDSYLSQTLARLRVFYQLNNLL